MPDHIVCAVATAPGWLTALAVITGNISAGIIAVMAHSQGSSAVNGTATKMVEIAQIGTAPLPPPPPEPTATGGK